MLELVLQISFSVVEGLTRAFCSSQNSGELGMAYMSITPASKRLRQEDRGFCSNQDHTESLLHCAPLPSKRLLGPTVTATHTVYRLHGTSGAKRSD